MPEYKYQAVDELGKRQKGVITSSAVQYAITDLRQRQLYVLRIAEKKQSIWTRDLEWIKPKVRRKELVVFCRQLATLTRAGISIVESLSILERQLTDQTLLKIIDGLTESMRQGESFSQALNHHSSFPPLFLNMIRAGEATGNMDEVLEKLAISLEKDHYTKEKVKSAMTYPIVVGVVALAVTIFLLLQVVPTFVTMFNQSHTPLPLPTRIVLSASVIVEKHIFFGLTLLISSYLIFKLWHRTSSGRLMWHTILLKLPIFGAIYQKSIIARFSRTLASLVSSAVPLLRSIDLVSDVVNNEVVANDLRASKSSLQAGNLLSDPLQKSLVFPPLVTQMIVIGEKTGSLDEMLDKIADFYEKDVDLVVDRLKTIIEPAMILLLSAVVGTIIAAVILPTFDLMKNYH